MSTTVSYKGQTLATVSNQTKTLLTEGKYLEDDITLVDVSGGGAVLTTKNISANGTYNASSDSADGYSQVNVSVPNTYSAGDEGKVVSNGALVAQTAHADVTPTTSDQTIDTTLNNSLKVKGDADLVAGNIKKDVEIFGVTGSYEGGGSVGSLVNYIEFIPTTEYNSNNRADVQLDVLTDTVILVHIDSFPDTSETETPGLYWANIFHGSIYATVGQGFLRVNGTIGSDNGWCSYNRTNGEISLGGSYGKLYPGSKYHIYQFGLTT